MINTFFSLDYNGFTSLIIRCCLFLAAGAVTWYLLFLLLSRILYRKAGHHKDHLLQLTGFWSLVLLMICTCIYFFILIRRNGFSSIAWTRITTLLGLLPMLLLYLTTIAVFALNYFSYRKKIVSNKII